jgi:hypothetical protein
MSYLARTAYPAGLVVNGPEFFIYGGAVLPMALLGPTVTIDAAFPFAPYSFPG